VALLGLCRADGLGEAELRGRAERFHGLVQALGAARQEEQLTTAMATGEGPPQLLLGAFGTLVFVFERGCPPEARRLLRGLKQGASRGGVFSACWALDIAAGKLHAHRWLPLVLFPGKRYARKLPARLPAPPA
jgi:hypothetical protein